jgi:hypothetical protein
MYRYTSAPPPRASTYLHPPLYPHNLAARFYDTTYMSRPYSYTEPRHYNSYYETSYTRPSTSHRPVQTETWRHVRPAGAPQSERTPRNSSFKNTASRHVHFDLPPAQGSSSRTIRVAEEERPRDRDRERTRVKERERDRDQESRYYIPSKPPSRHEPEERMPRKHHSYTSTYEHDSHIHRERYHRTSSPPRNSLPRSNSTYTRIPPPHQPQSQPPIPSRPTVYIITYATDIVHNESSVATLLASQVPRRHPPIPHLYTIDARDMRPPSASLCAQYSGISPLIQDMVMEDGEARRAARTAVKELLRFGAGERRGRFGGGRGSDSVEVSMSVCCHSGTHRSVAIAERIAQCVKSEVGKMRCEEGVRVVCRHVHRVKGRRDPF